eukprot:gene4489-35137_t
MTDWPKLAAAAAAGAAVAVGLMSRRAAATVAVKAGAVPASISKAKYTLHVYDHCPFCIRVELLLGWKGISYDRVVYGYGDALGSDKPLTYKGDRILTGKKQLPVLEFVGKGGKLLPESGDIIALLEDPLVYRLPPKSERQDLKDFFSGGFKVLSRELTRPRIIKMTHLRDWAKPEDVAYAKDKYIKGGFNYEEAEANDASNKKAMEQRLVKLNELLLSDSALNDGGVGLTWDDLVYLPDLRTLSCVEGLAWPPRLKAYVEAAFSRANVQTYFP